MLPTQSYLTSCSIRFKSASFHSYTPIGSVHVPITPDIQDHQAVNTLIFATDRGLKALAKVGAVWGSEILITLEHSIMASSAIVVNLTDREKPVYPWV